MDRELLAVGSSTGKPYYYIVGAGHIEGGALPSGRPRCISPHGAWWWTAADDDVEAYMAARRMAVALLIETDEDEFLRIIGHEGYVSRSRFEQPFASVLPKQ